MKKQINGTQIKINCGINSMRCDKIREGDGTQI